MIDVETEIEPPGLPSDEDDDEWEGIGVHVIIYEPDGTARSGSARALRAASDDDLADAVIATVRGVAACRGPGLAAAVARRLREATT